jgi:hypothetical protein
MLKTWCLIRSLYKCICKNLVRKLWTVSAILMLKLVTLTMQDSPKYLKRAKFPFLILCILGDSKITFDSKYKKKFWRYSWGSPHLQKNKETWLLPQESCKEALNSISYSYAQTGYFDYARLTKIFEKGEISTLL